jgi:hypothetical protein
VFACPDDSLKHLWGLHSDCRLLESSNSRTRLFALHAAKKAECEFANPADPLCTRKGKFCVLAWILFSSIISCEDGPPLGCAISFTSAHSLSDSS